MGPLLRRFAAWRGAVQLQPRLSQTLSHLNVHPFGRLETGKGPPTMATVAPPPFAQAEPADPSFKPQEISFPLPKALHTTAHVHLSFLENCAMIFLATSTPGDSGGTVKPLGSFVYALPDVSVSPAYMVSP